MLAGLDNMKCLALKERQTLHIDPLSFDIECGSKFSTHLYNYYNMVIYVMSHDIVQPLYILFIFHSLIASLHAYRHTNQCKL